MNKPEQHIIDECDPAVIEYLEYLETELTILNNAIACMAGKREDCNQRSAMVYALKKQRDL